MGLLLYLVQSLHTQKEGTSYSGMHIPCYILVICYVYCTSDEGVCFPIQKGLAVSRSKLKFFRHNDMDHLEQLLEEQKRLDEKVETSLHLLHL